MVAHVHVSLMGEGIDGNGIARHGMGNGQWVMVHIEGTAWDRMGDA